MHFTLNTLGLFLLEQATGGHLMFHAHKKPGNAHSTCRYGVPMYTRVNTYVCMNDLYCIYIYYIYTCLQQAYC